MPTRAFLLVWMCCALHVACIHMQQAPTARCGLAVALARINSRFGLVPWLLSMHYLQGTEWQAVCLRVRYLSLTLSGFAYRPAGESASLRKRCRRLSLGMLACVVGQKVPVVYMEHTSAECSSP